MLLFVVGSPAFVLPLSWAGALFPWSSWKTILPMAVGVLVLVVLAVYESRPIEPVFPYRILRFRTALVTLVGAFVHGMVLHSILLYLPLIFDAVFLGTPLRSAISILPSCAFVMVFTVVAAIGVEYFRQYRWEIWLGWLLLAFGMVLSSLWDRNSSLAETASFQAIWHWPGYPLQRSAHTHRGERPDSGRSGTFNRYFSLVPALWRTCWPGDGASSL